MKITKCIIPAGWYGTRLLPGTKAQPKEMFPIIDTPVIQLLVQEAVKAGITDIMIVTSRGKWSIVDHFDSMPDLERTLEKKWKLKELEQVRAITRLAKISFTRQSEARGDGDAILQAKTWAGNDPCLVLFGDDIIEWEKNGAEQLLEVFEKNNNPTLITQVVSTEEVSSYGIIETTDKNGILSIERFLEKPSPEETDSRLSVIGKYIITPEVFDYIEKNGTSTSKDGEIRLADAFVRMLEDNKELNAVVMQWERYDAGDKFGLVKATIDFALKDEKLGPKVREFLKAKSL